LLLRPRKFQYKNLHKHRRVINAKINKLTYGQYGLRILQPLWVNNKQIFRYKLFLKKAAKRSDKTSRKVWFNLFPHLPLTRKVEGSRMGKGKGKLAG
jgi:large subunit ribosomal protein L16